MGDVDTCLELSGVGAGLQTAIDATGYGGKVRHRLLDSIASSPESLTPLRLGLCGGMLQVVVGSWYGDKAVPLHLGLGFHRSHMRLIVSQVGPLSATHPCRLPAPFNNQTMGVGEQHLGAAAGPLEQGPSLRLHVGAGAAPASVGPAHHHLHRPSARRPRLPGPRPAPGGRAGSHDQVLDRPFLQV